MVTSAMASSIDAAIPFISVEKNNKLLVHDAACNVLKTLTGKIGVVAVAGLYRTGKSYLLNQLLEKHSGFGVGPTVKAHTKGIWMWGAPVPHRFSNGEEGHLIFLDTEGLGSVGQNQSHDARIFALAVLLSSYLIYNSVGNIDESAIMNLSLISSITRHIHVNSRSPEEEDDGTEYDKYFPSFLWVVRDFSLLLQEDGKEITPSQYLDKALELQEGFSDSVMARNRIRNMISTFFKDRDCVTMVRPISSEKELQHLEKVSVDKIRPQFTEQIRRLREKVYLNVQPKTIKANSFNGNAFATMAMSYVDAINTGGVPTISAAWDRVVSSECEQAIDESVQSYVKAMDGTVRGRLPMEEDELRKIHSDHKEAALKSFLDRFIGEDLPRFLNIFRARIAREFDDFLSKNRAQSLAVCNGLSEQIIGPILTNLREDKYRSVQEFELERSRTKARFLEGAKGPSKSAILLEMSEKTLLEGAIHIAGSTERKHEAALSQLREQLASRTASLEAQVNMVEEQRNTLQGRLNEAEQQLAQMNGRESTLRENLDSLQKGASVTEAKHAQMVSDLAEMKGREKALKEMLDQAQKKHLQDMDDMNSDFKKRLRDEVEDKCSVLVEEIKTLRHQLDDKALEAETATADLAKIRIELETATENEKSALDTSMHHAKGRCQPCAIM